MMNAARLFDPRLAALGVCFVLACGPAPDSTPDAAVGTEPSLSPEATAMLVESFRAELEAAWAQAQETGENFPAATAAFILPDGRVFGFATGESDVDDDIPMTPDRRMGSGSIGKTYVAAAAPQLAMNGELDLDAPVSTWLGDEDWFARVPNHADLTVRHLLNHTAGMIQPYFEDPHFAVRLSTSRRSFRQGVCVRLPEPPRNILHSVPVPGSCRGHFFPHPHGVAD